MSAAPRHAVEAVIGALSVDPSRPRLTAFDPDGNRTELSGTALLNWASKVAGLLVDELGGEHGDVVVVRSPVGWQTAGILIGAWWAGSTVTSEDSADALAAFVADGGDALADEVFVVSGHPLGAPSRQVKPHQRDYTGAVLGQADRFGSRNSVSPEVLAVSGPPAVTVSEFDRQIRVGSALSAADRVVTGGGWDLPHQVVEQLLAPLAAGASVIVCADWADAGLFGGDATGPTMSEAQLHRLDSEGATHLLASDGNVRPLG
ncbi:TIGR03089 family protein [Nakamurella silvestris]|nr:TIGR03089 family protein [Nakamurella silvestris]